MAVATVDSSPHLLEEIIRLAQSCYQCGRCAGGCPMAFAMEQSPRALLRLLQLGLLDEALGSSTPWLCAGCHGCSFCCPRGVDLTGLMYKLRQRAVATGVDNESVAFYREFVASALKRGAVYEPELMVGYARRIGLRALAPHLRMAIRLALRGKLNFKPRAIADAEGLRQAIQKAMDGEARRD